MSGGMRENLLTKRDAATILRVSVRTIERCISEGKLKPVRLIEASLKGKPYAGKLRFVLVSGNETYSDELRQELYAATQSNWLRAGKIVSAPSKVAQHKDTGFIKDIIPLLRAKEEAVVFEVAATLSLLVQKVPVESLPELDARIRTWAVTAHALLALRRRSESRTAFQRAAGLTQDEATRRFLLNHCSPE
jgi:hypothetical protein